MFSTDRRTFTKGAALIGIGAAGGGLQGLTPVDAATAAAADSDASQAVPLAPPDRQPPNLKLPPIVKRTGWAVVGLGQLAVEEILPAFGQCKRARLAAFVSGHPDKARHLAKVYGVDETAIYDYDNIHRLADDKSVDVVYIVLPNSMHAEYTIKALGAGKHVLCEKPMATSPEDCERMIAAAKKAGKQLGIAYRLHYEPLNMKAADLCRSGTIGKIKTISASNCQDTKAPNIRLSAKLGGGPVGDVGVYCINGASWVLGEQPRFVTAHARWPKDDSRFAEVPESVSFVLEYPSGVTAACECSFGTSVGRRYRINGDKGFVEMDPAYAYNGLDLRLKTGEEEKGSAAIAKLALAQKNHFTEEMDAFSQVITDGGEFRTDGPMGLADVKVVAAVMEAARTGAKVEVL